MKIANFLTIKLLFIIPASTLVSLNSAEITISKEKGAKYQSIQQAIDNAKDGDSILIKPGIFQENVVVNKSIRLKGSGPNKTVITSVQKPMESLQEVYKKIASIKDKKEQKAAAKEILKQFMQPTILIENTQKVEITDLKITSHKQNKDPKNVPRFVLRISNAGALIGNCMIIGGNHGLVIEEKSNVTVKKSLFAAVLHAGITIGDQGGGSSKVKILESDIRNCKYAGIIIRKDNKVLVQRCRISGAAWHGIRFDDASPIINENLIFGNARSGIYVSGKTNGTIEKNVFFKNEMYGVSCWGHGRDKIQNNVFASNLREGLEIVDATCKPKISKNIFYNSPIAIVLWNMKKTELDLNNIENNIFWGNKNILMFQAKNSEGKVLSESINLSNDLKNKVVDPGFENIVENKFNLLPDSQGKKLGIEIPSHIEFTSPWKLTPEEKAIIPDTDTRASNKWKIK